MLTTALFLPAMCAGQEFVSERGYYPYQPMPRQPFQTIIVEYGTSPYGNGCNGGQYNGFNPYASNFGGAYPRLYYPPQPMFSGQINMPFSRVGCVGGQCYQLPSRGGIFR